MKLSVITPTYNRANVLKRVYDSLVAQTYKNFEWIVIDDGSEDNTKEVIEEYIKQGIIDIIYFHQTNNGKHIAVNKGVELASGEFILIADSDDSFISTSFEILVEAWNAIPKDEQKKFRGITCKCYNPESGEAIGREIPNGHIDLYGLDATYKNKLNFEMWGMNRTDLMRKFPFPNIRGGKESGLVFFPETVIWDNMGRIYKARYINDALRAYYLDQDNATTKKSTRRSRENIFLWEHLINDVLDYFIYNPKRFVKAFVGISMDGLLNGESYVHIVRRVKGIAKKIIVTMFFPVGLVLYYLKK